MELKNDNPEVTCGSTTQPEEPMPTSKRKRRRRIPRTNPTLAVGYGRTCTGEPGNLDASEQEDEVRGWCKKENLELISWHQDLDVDGTIEALDRKGFASAFDDLRKHRAGLLVIAGRERLARDAIVACFADREVEAIGAKIVSVGGLGRSGDGIDTFHKRLEDAVFEYELAKRRLERVAR